MYVPKYSVQYLMDCDERNFACDGGWMLDAFEFTRQNGIVNWQDYSHDYLSRMAKCAKVSNDAERFYNSYGYEEDMVSN